MKRSTKREIGEWSKAVIGLVVGALALLFAEVCWIAHHDWFCIPISVAEERRVREETYTRVAVCPIDEFAGLETNAWCMKTNLPIVISDCGDIIGELAKGAGR